jgi:hypothetical protein
MLVGPITTPACTGADGSGAATVTTGEKVTGLVYAAYVSYVGDDPATTDVTISTRGTSPAAPSYNILVATNLAADVLYYPRAVSHVNTTGVAGTTNDQLVPVDDYITVTVAQANTGDIIKVWLMVI